MYLTRKQYQQWGGQELKLVFKKKAKTKNLNCGARNLVQRTELYDSHVEGLGRRVHEPWYCMVHVAPRATL